MRISTLVAAAWMALGQGALAGSPVVVELYTSQGCSSCPPADALLGEIAKRDDVIALALHVDYWDYLGWKDVFANPANAERQRAYSRAAGKKSVYTPQMVIAGKDHIVGTKPMKLVELLDKYHAAPDRVAVKLDRANGRVDIQLTATGPLPSQGAIVNLVTWSPTETITVRRGENAGRTLAYHNVVRDFVKVGRWDGRGTYRATVRVPDGIPMAVLVQGFSHGPMLGAARLQ